jgi:Holliday junction resolvase
MLSKAKSQAMARDLKSSLEKRGFSVVQSDLAKGTKLAIDSSMSIKIEAKDAVSKDIFGNSLDSFAPHEVKFAIDNAVATHTEVAKVMMELAKQGVALKIGEAATLAAAETAADAAEEQRHNMMWPTKGA